MRKATLAALAALVLLVAFIAFGQTVAEKIYTYPVRWSSRFVVEKQVAQFDVGATIGDGGTSTSLVKWGACTSADAGTPGIATCTATVRTSSKCQCTNATSIAAVKCAVSSVTMTASTAAESDSVTYVCFSP